MSEQLTPTQRVEANATWANSCSFDEKWEMQVVEKAFAIELATELERVKEELKEALLPRIEEVQIHAVTAERDQLKRQVEELKRECSEIISLRGLGDRDRWKARAEKAVEALTQISKRDDWTSGECRYHARQAIDEAMK